mgnify:CR=1 FL=1
MIRYSFKAFLVGVLLSFTSVVFAQQKITVLDETSGFPIHDVQVSIIFSDSNFIKGNTKVEVLAKVEKNKIDKYFFSEGFFNFKDKSHLAKETKIKTHKDVFGNINNDPRIYGTSSLGNPKKTIVNNAIFTSCKLNDDCPPWSIEAEKITHDKVKKDMIYKNAILKIYDFPVL